MYKPEIKYILVKHTFENKLQKALNVRLFHFSLSKEYLEQTKVGTILHSILSEKFS
jgi:hypothetical protein